jgi:hypothetical protein
MFAEETAISANCLNKRGESLICQPENVLQTHIRFCLSKRPLYWQIYKVHQNVAASDPIRRS